MNKLILCVMLYVLCSTFFPCYSLYIFHPDICGEHIIFKLNVPPSPCRPCQAFVRSEFKPLQKHLHIELSSILKLLLCLICLSVLFLSRIGIYYGISSSSSLTYRNLILMLLFLSYFTIFDYYFIIFLPFEFFKFQIFVGL